MLRESALILKEYTRQSDAVGRYGGDEFLVLMPGPRLEGALIVADRIRQAFEETVVHVPTAPPEGIQITTTGGISEYKGDIEQAEILIEAADQALYMGKHEGANRVYIEFMVKDEPVIIATEDLTQIETRDTGEESVRTIGKRLFTYISKNQMEPGHLLSCKLTLKDEDEQVTISGLITESTSQTAGGYEIVFQPVEQGPRDWM